MEVIKAVRNGKKVELTKTTYIRADKTPIIGLDSSIEYYEIKVMPYPDNYDPNKHNISEVLTLTENKGEFLKICLAEWQLTEKPQAEVLKNFNTSFGIFIDAAYPLWQRVKDYSIKTDEGLLRQAQEKALRDERQQREDDYINKNIFPNFKFTWL